MIQGFQPSAVTMLGGVFMAGGSLLYLDDSSRTLRNFHTFLPLAFVLMAIGAVIAFLGAVFVDRNGV